MKNPFISGCKWAARHPYADAEMADEVAKIHAKKYGKDYAASWRYGVNQEWWNPTFDVNGKLLPDNRDI